MTILDGDLSQIRNKVVRGQLLAKQKREKNQSKLKKRIARKEAEERGEEVKRGFTRTIENTKEWLGDSEEYADPRTRPAKVEVDSETGDVRVDLGTLSNLFPSKDNKEASTSSTSASLGPPPPEPKLLITTSPGKPPAPYTKTFCDDLQALLGGSTRADIVPRRSPKFELGKVARWAKGRGYGAIAVVGEDHRMPTTLTLSLLPSGPTAHFRLSGTTLCKDIKGHAKPTSHPPELVLNHFSTPLGLSLASLLSGLFLPPSAADLLSRQGFQGRQVVLAQNSRDFVFIRRYRYMFALKGHRLGSKKKVGLERQTPLEEGEDDTIKTRFQEIGPRMTIKMRWIRRGALGETGDERAERGEREKIEMREMSKDERDALQSMTEFNEGAENLDEEEVGGQGENGNATDGQEEEEAANAIGLDRSDETGQPNFDIDKTSLGAAGDGENEEGNALDADDQRPRRTTPRKRKRPYHPLLHPAPSPEPGEGENGYGPELVPLLSQKGRRKDEERSLLSTVGKTWHAGKGEGGVREGAKRREWNWEAKMQVSRRKFFL